MKSLLIVLFALSLSLALPFSLSASEKVKISSKTSCDRVDGTECTDRIKKNVPLVPGKRTGTGEHLAPDGVNPQDVGAKMGSCYFSPWYYVYAPSGYYICGSKHFQTYPSKQSVVISSQYCYNGHVYGTIASYAMSYGSCYISYAYYRTFYNAIAVRTYYCC